MDKDEVLVFLEEKLSDLQKYEPQAFNTIAAYRAVIDSLMSEE